MSGTVGAHYAAFTSGSGNDTVSLTGRSGNGLNLSSLDVDDGNNLTEINGSLNGVVSSTIVSGLRDDTFFIGSTGGANVIRGNSVAGNLNGDSVQLHGNVYAENGGSNRVETGSGNDRISLDGEVNTGGLYLSAGDGFDVLALTAASGDEFNDRYRDWLTDLDAKGLIPGMGIESISLHGVAELDSVAWLLDLAQRYGIELVLENGQSLPQSAVPGISALSMDALFVDFDGYDDPPAVEDHNGHESRYLFNDAVHASGGEHAKPDAVSFANASYEDGADHSYLFTLTNGATM